MSTSATSKKYLIAKRKHFWIHEILAPGFFLICVGIFSAVCVNLFLSESKKTTFVAAKEPSQSMSLSRTPYFHVGGNKFSVLGLGQDQRSGKQVVWIKNVKSNEIRSYRKGQPLFKSLVKIDRITNETVYINNLGKRTPVSLP